ncbi:hypothetical protein EDD18DRAFT_1108993 [Armillaria luteobubalina]|uniref:Uncharacterized protein n=1 Tax=Armillaria luteobubalina TaxID=153913 RepID=A0AA39TJV8_9AGAR|nr:hypothetical protein EDD18DRAFT_1108993 [Armillaria luteobubalina]
MAFLQSVLKNSARGGLVYYQGKGILELELPHTRARSSYTVMNTLGIGDASERWYQVPCIFSETQCDKVCSPPSSQQNVIPGDHCCGIRRRDELSGIFVVVIVGIRLRLPLGMEHTWLVRPEKADGQWSGKMVNVSERWPLFQVCEKKDNCDESEYRFKVSNDSAKNHSGFWVYPTSKLVLRAYDQMGAQAPVTTQPYGLQLFIYNTGSWAVIPQQASRARQKSGTYIIVNWNLSLVWLPQYAAENLQNEAAFKGTTGNLEDLQGNTVLVYGGI